MSVPTRRPRPAALVLTTAAAAALVVLPAGLASAHVRVEPDTSAAGGYAVLTFRVPTESDTAGTTRLEVTLPTDTPFTSVRTEPIAGWTSEVVRGALPEPVDVQGASITEAPLSVVWTADTGTEVAPGQFQRFVIQVGPLPADEDTEVLLPTEQTYSDGETVAWDQPTPADGEEPEYPAPAFTTTAAADEEPAAEEETDAEGAGSEGSVDAAVVGDGADAGDDTTARLLGGAGLVLGAGALGTVLLRGRRAGS